MSTKNVLAYHVYYKKFMKECNNLMIGLESLKWLSEQLGKPESTIRTWKRRGDIPIDCFKEIGGTVFVRVEKFKEWVEKE